VLERLPIEVRLLPPLPLLVNPLAAVIKIASSPGGMPALFFIFPLFSFFSPIILQSSYRPEYFGVFSS